MDFSHYSDLPVQMAVDLVNTRNPLTGEDALRTIEDLAEFLGAYGRDWAAEGWYTGEPRRADVERVVALRERLRRVFEATDEAEAADVLNALLEDSSATPRMSVHGDSPHLHFEPSAGSIADWLAVALCMGLAVVMVDHGFDRFGICGADDCVDVFVDTSKNRSRTKCSTSCTTRANVAAYRERQRNPSTTRMM